jgi:PIF1 helicase.
MLRNLNQSKLCNGTRLAVKKMVKNLNEATIMLGKLKGGDVLIPRNLLMSTDVAFEFKRA